LTPSSSAPIGTLSFKEALAVLPEFSGSPDQDINSWLAELETLVVDPGLCAKVGRSKLGGKPKEWLLAQGTVAPTVEGWTMLSDSLRKMYADPQRERAALNALSTLRWSPQAPLSDHLVSMLTLMEKAGISQEEKRIDFLISSVPTSAKQFTLLSPGTRTSIEACIEALRLWERTNDPQPPFVNPVAPLNPNTPTAQTRRCFVCNSPDHIASFHKNQGNANGQGNGQQRLRPPCPVHGREFAACLGCPRHANARHCERSCRLRSPAINATVTPPDASGPTVSTVILESETRDDLSNFKLKAEETEPAISSSTLVARAWTFQELPCLNVAMEDPIFPWISALIDTGAEVNVVTKSVIVGKGDFMRPSRFEKLQGIGGHQSKVLGEVSLRLQIGETRIETPFLVTEAAPAPMILGCPGIRAFGMVINLKKNQIHLEDGTICPLKDHRLAAKSCVTKTIPAKTALPISLHKFAIENCSLAFSGYSNFAYTIPEGIVASENPVVMVCNHTDRILKIKEGQFLGELSITKLNEETAETPECLSTTLDVSRRIDLIKYGNYLNTAELDQYKKLVEKYREVFDPITSPSNIPPMSIEPLCSKPIVTRPTSKVPAKHESFVRETLESMRLAGMVRFSESSFHSPLLVVKKPHGRGWRLVVDYRAVNANTRPIHTVLPVPEHILAGVQGFKVMSTFDLTNGFWQMKLREDACQYTAFGTPDGLMEYLVAPMGLTNSPHYFNRGLQTVFADQIKEKQLKVYFDDMSLFSKDHKAHLIQMEEMFKTCVTNNIKIHPEKTLIGSDKGNCLGYEVTINGIRPGIEKTQALIDMPRPVNVSEVRSFLGLASYFRRFIPDLARRVEPLTALTAKDVPFEWNDAQENAVKYVKAEITKKIELHHFNPEVACEITCDASTIGWSATLKQEGNVIAFNSGRFTDTQSRYAAHEREALGALAACERFRYYVIGGPLTLITDSKAISWLRKSKELTPKLFRWAMRLEEFDAVIKHRPGLQIPVEDAGSRLTNAPTEVELDIPPEKEAPEFLETPTVTFVYRSQFSNQLAREPQSKPEQPTPKILPKASVNPLLIPPTSSKEQLKLIKMVHGSGHFDADSTVARIRRFASWPAMENQAKSVIQNCKCQFQKYGKIAKREVGSHSHSELFHTIFVDFAGPFEPTSNNNRYYLVIVDGFSGSVTAVPTASNNWKTTEAALSNWMAVNDIPKVIITDRASIFEGYAAKSFLEQHKIKRLEISAYHQSTNGKAERMIGSIKERLRTTEAHPQDWDTHLNSAVRAINNHIGPFGFSPNEIKFGRTGRGELNPFDPIEMNLHSIEKKIRKVAEERETARPNLATGSFAKVFLDEPRHFLIPRWNGPYLILSRTNHTALLLRSDGTSFRKHIDKLAPCFIPSNGKFVTHETSPTASLNKEPVYEVEKILAHREDQEGRLSYLVKWLDYPSSANSWEPASHFKQIKLIKEYHKGIATMNPKY